MTETTTKPRRRWLRFSLRTLLVVIAVGCVWLGSIANRAQKQRRAVEVITNLGGTVNYDYESDGLKRPAYPAWLRNLLPQDYLTTVNTVRLSKSQITDDDLQILANLPDLVFLDLQGTKISDVGVRTLGILTKLRVLILNGTDCTDRGVESLKSLTNIFRLGLSGTKISDEGLSILCSMPSLTMLDISSTNVGDLGLPHLRRVHLATLNIIGTKVTAAGLSQLKELPDLDYLYLSDRLITPAGINALQGIPKLKTLYINLEPIEGWLEIYAELEQALPGVGVIQSALYR